MAGPHKQFEYPYVLEITANFDETRFITQGGYGRIYRGEITQPNEYGLSAQTVAVKVQRNDRDSKPEFEKELLWMQRFHHHPNMIQLIGSCRYGGDHNNDELLLVMEYAAGGTLSSVIQALNWEETLKLVKELSGFCTYIGRLGIVMCDLKPQNILIKDSQLKVCDFGAMCLSGDGSNFIGTHGYMDPELTGAGVAEGRQTFEDMYALGVIIMQLISKADEAIYQPPGSLPARNIAQDVREVVGSAVHQRLRSTGCSKRDAQAITDLVKYLTRRPRDREVSEQDQREMVEQVIGSLKVKNRKWVSIKRKLKGVVSIFKP